MADYDLTQQQLEEGHKKCLENVHKLLDSANLLLENETSYQYALGLYMYAIEEYGKAEILRDCLLENKSNYIIPEWIFGKGKLARKGHERKLGVGIQRLPAICRQLSRTIKIISTATEEVQTFQIEKHGVLIGSISVPVYLSGTFEDPTLRETINLDLKAACFYVDWDNKGHWNYVILADKDQLIHNIKEINKVISGHIS
jgi:AbiV family abortive infection protein